MIIPYTYSDPLLPDIEVELECSLEWSHGEPVVSVDDVTVDGISFYRHPDPQKLPFFLQLAFAIQDRAEDDDDVLMRLLEAEGVSFVGGANNPDGHFVRAS